MLLGSIIVFGILLRSYRFSAPPFDSYAFRQTQTAGTIWLWDRDGLDLLDYRVPVFGGGHWVLEFPGYQLIAYLLAPLTGGTEHAARIVSIAAYVASAVLLYLIVEQMTRRRLPALAAVFVFSVVPISVFYFRAVMIDTLAIALSLAAFYLTLRFRARPTIALAIGIWTTALLAALTKPPVLSAFLAPIVVLYALALYERRRKVGIWVATLAGAAVTATVLVAWKEHTDALNASANGLTFEALQSWYFGTTFSDPHLFATMWERALPNIGYVGLILVVAGLVSAATVRGVHRTTLIALAVGTPVSIAVFANLNRVHDYYQLPYYVTISVFAGLGVAFVADALALGSDVRKRQIVMVALGALCVTTTADLFRGYFARDAVNAGFGAAGALIREGSEPRDQVVVVTEGGDYNDSTLLYAARRTGWIVDKTRPDLLQKVDSSMKTVGAIVVLKGAQGVPPWAGEYAARKGLAVTTDAPEVMVFGGSSAGPG